jgi:hypothetical protein
MSEIIIGVSGIDPARATPNDSVCIRGFVFTLARTADWALIFSLRPPHMAQARRSSPGGSADIGRGQINLSFLVIPMAKA